MQPRQPEQTANAEPTMATRPLRLPKPCRLCSKKAVDALFAPGHRNDSAIAYPIRAVWQDSDDAADDRFLISIPKKRLRHAVDRVRMRRLVREAYRLNRHEFAVAGNPHKNIAFIYVANELRDFGTVVRAMRRILSQIHHDGSKQCES